MDPNTTLANALRAAEEILVRDPYEERDTNYSTDINLAAYLTSLDEWITKGGFLPARWGNPPGGTWTELLQMADDTLALDELARQDPDRPGYTMPGQIRMAKLIMELGKAMGWVK